MGGVITPLRKDDEEAVNDNDFNWTVIGKLVKKLSMVIKLECSLQCKLLVLRHISKSLVYRAQTCYHPCADKLFSTIDDLLVKALENIFPDIEPQEHTDRILSPIEDGGLGFYAYHAISSYLLGQAIDTAQPFLCFYNLKKQLLAPYCNETTLTAAWKKGTRMHLFFGGKRGKDGRSFERGDFVSWMDVRPKGPYTRLKDEALIFHVNVILDNAKPFEGVCADKEGKAFVKMGKKEFTRHLLTCAACTTWGFYGRHQQIVNVLRNTCKFYGIHSFVPKQNEMPLPDREKGGPDLMIPIGAVEKADGSKICTYDAIDVSVAAAVNPAPGQNVDDMLARRFDTKMRKYGRFESLTGYRIVPFVVSQYGLVAKQTRELIAQWKARATDLSFLADIYTNVQVALIHSQFAMYDYVRKKTMLTIQQRQWIMTDQTISAEH